MLFGRILYKVSPYRINYSDVHIYIMINLSNDSHDRTNTNVEMRSMAVKYAHTECSKYLRIGEWIKDTLR